jgi:hypothetical protein
MKHVKLKENGAGYEDVFVAPLSGKIMVRTPFLLDPGATRTTINKTLLTTLGYGEEWLQKNKIVLTEEEKPFLADGSRLDAYGVPSMRLTIAEHEIFHDGYFLTSDNAPKLSFLLGVDILSYFDINFKYSEWRVYYEFRKDRTYVPPISGRNFAYETS